MWKAQLTAVDNGVLTVRFYHEDGRERFTSYKYTGTETVAQLRAPVQAEVAELNDRETQVAAMTTKLSAYIGKDIA